MCWSLFLIKNFKKNYEKETPTQVLSYEYCGNFKITCFEEHLQMAASIRWFLYDIGLRHERVKQSCFCTNYSFKILVSEWKYKNNLKSWISKTDLLQSSYTVYNVYIMFFCDIYWFYQDFKSGNLCFLNLYSVDAARILDLTLEVVLSPLKWRMKHFYNYKSFSFMSEQVF